MKSKLYRTEYTIHRHIEDAIAELKLILNTSLAEQIYELRVLKIMNRWRVIVKYKKLRLVMEK